MNCSKAYSLFAWWCLLVPWSGENFNAKENFNVNARHSFLKLKTDVHVEGTV